MLLRRAAVLGVVLALSSLLVLSSFQVSATVNTSDPEDDVWRLWFTEYNETTDELVLEYYEKGDFSSIIDVVDVEVDTELASGEWTVDLTVTMQDDLEEALDGDFPVHFTVFVFVWMNGTPEDAVMRFIDDEDLDINETCFVFAFEPGFFRSISADVDCDKWEDGISTDYDAQCDGQYFENKAEATLVIPECAYDDWDEENFTVTFMALRVVHIMFDVGPTLEETLVVFDADIDDWTEENSEDLAEKLAGAKEITEEGDGIDWFLIGIVAAVAVGATVVVMMVRQRGLPRIGKPRPGSKRKSK